VADDGRGSPLLVYSLLVATFLGTMGLPHILVRFYTNPDGPAARRTTVRVLGLLGMFYLFPAVYGLLGRVLVPEVYVTGDTDSVVLRLPEAAWPGAGGEILAAVVAAGAFAAFMSTASGLLVSVAGTLSYDVWGRLRRGRRPGPPAPPPASARDGFRRLRPSGRAESLPQAGIDRRMRFRVAAVAGMVLPAIAALGARHLDISVLVGWAFALAASTFCPLLLLGIWWTRLTTRGAAAGMAVGSLIATAAILTAAIAEPSTETAIGALLTQPAVVTVPIAFAVMAGVSLLERAAPVESTMLALHAPEGLGVEPP
jgi:cation/acetate symporter